MGENSDIFQEMFVAGLEAVSDSAEKVKEVVDNLVEEGKVKDGKGKEFVDEAMQKGANFGKGVEGKIYEMIEGEFKKINLASHPDFQKVLSEISQLKNEIAKLKEEKQETEEK